MQIQLEFLNRDILREACELRLKGNKDLLQHFVQNNARNFDRDTSRDDIWDAMGEIMLTPSTASYEARQEFVKVLYTRDNVRVDAARDYLSIGEFSKAVTTLHGLVQHDPDLTRIASRLDSIALLHAIQHTADRLRATVKWPTEQLEQQYIWAIENDSRAINTIKYQARFSQHCGSAISSLVRRIARDAGFTPPRNTEMAFIVSEVNLRILNRTTGIRYQKAGSKSPTGRLTESQPEFQEFPPSTEKEEPMNTLPTVAVAFETVHYVYGTDVTKMTDDRLVEAIKQVEAEIAKLDVVKTKSKKIDAKKAELNEMLAKIVDTLDAR